MILDRFRQRYPEWEARPEDPATVLLELWADLLVEVGGDVDRMEERLVERLVRSSGAEACDPRPATGVLQFVPAKDLPEDQRCSVPAGTQVTTDRTGGGTKVVFETLEDVWLSEQPLQRAYALCDGNLTLLPIESARPDGAPARDGHVVHPFGDRCDAGRYLYLGDRSFESLRRVGGSVTLEWPGSPTVISDASWEYRHSDGWRSVDRRCAIVPSSTIPSTRPSDRTRDSDDHTLQVHIDGPLPDLVSSSLEGITLPWLRATLSPKMPLDRLVPRVNVGSSEWRVVSRGFVDGVGTGLEDLSFSDTSVAIEPRPDDCDACLFFGVSAPEPFSLYVHFQDNDRRDLYGSTLTDWSVRPPQLEWEYSAGGAWKPFASGHVRDRTNRLQCSGSVHVEFPDDTAPQPLFGESLCWVRARWCAGSFLAAPGISRLSLNAVEVTQGVTHRNVPIGVGRATLHGWIDVPEFADGVPERFDRISVQLPDSLTQWSRAEALAGRGDGDRWFVLRRPSTGKLELSFDGDVSNAHGSVPSPCVPSGEARVVIPRVRVNRGAAGNLPSGSITRIEPPNPIVAAVRQSSPTAGGVDVEPVDALGRRTIAWAYGGEFAVTVDDFRRLASVMVPDARRVDVWPDPRNGAQVLVSVLPSGPQLPASLSQALERYLSDHAPIGTAVRVVSGTLLPATLELELKARDPDQLSLSSGKRLGAFSEWVGEVLRAELGATGPNSSDVPPVAVFPSEALTRCSLRSVISEALHGRLEGEGLPSVKLEGMEVVRAELIDAVRSGDGSRPTEGGTGGADDRLRASLSANGRGYYIEVRAVSPVINGPGKQT